MNDTAPTQTAPDDHDGFEWAVVEIFGHRRHAGRCREEERFGAKMLRVDVPTLDYPPDTQGNEPVVTGWISHFYGGGSLFSYTPTDEASALRINRPYHRPGRYLAPPDDHGEAGEDQGLAVAEALGS